MDKKHDKKPKAPKDNSENNEEDIDILVCARTQNNPDILKGSIWDKCRECGATIWISLSGQRALKQSQKLVPFCIECAAKKHLHSADFEVKAAPGSLQELRNYLAGRRKH